MRFRPKKGKICNQISSRDQEESEKTIISDLRQVSHKCLKLAELRRELSILTVKLLSAILPRCQALQISPKTPPRPILRSCTQSTPKKVVSLRCPAVYNTNSSKRWQLITIIRPNSNHNNPPRKILVTVVFKR